MRDIAFFSNRKTGKKNVLTVQSVQSVRMLTWKSRTTCGKAKLVGTYDTWQVLVGSHVDELAYDT